MKVMGSWILPLLLFGSLFSSVNLASCHHDSVEDGVAVLNDQNIHPFISAHKLVLVKFYAKWCIHCQNLAPHFASAAKILTDDETGIILGKIDCDQARSVVTEFGIEGYPTLKFFKNGHPIDYNGPRETEAIVSAAKELLLPALLEVPSFDPSDEIALIATSPPAELLDCISNQAELNRSTLKSFLVTQGESKIEVFQPDEGFIPFTGSTCEDLAQFILTESLSLFGEINQANYLKYISSGKDLAWFCGTEEDYAKHKVVFLQVARALRDSVSFVWLDSLKFTSVQEAFAIENLPSVAFQTATGRYILGEEKYSFGSKEAILSFFEDVAKGKVEKSVRSEEAPSEDDGKVKTIVGKTLEPLVTQSEKDILLMVYAPHCEHCKKFMPEFEAFANDNNFENLLIAKINGDANESSVDYIAWDAFPTVLFIRSGSKSAVQFDGERTKEVLSAFVNEQIAAVHTEL